MTDKYSLWQPIGFWATTLSTFLKILKHLSNINFLKKLLEIGGIIASMYSTYMLLVIYPLDFSRVGYGWLDPTFGLALNVALFAMSFAILINFIRIFIPKRKK